MNIKLGYLSKYLDFKKIAQAIHDLSSQAVGTRNYFKSHRNLQGTITKARTKADLQPLNNITENKIIDKPMDITTQQVSNDSTRNLSHMKDNRILNAPKFIKSR